MTTDGRDSGITAILRASTHMASRAAAVATMKTAVAT